ncbi:hypothetical protein [Streptomyces syringium]|uniref:hypothetical protein n=1 Tax=Streptomyces syringium TaxID=76729 RepID=UPI003456BB2B
MGEVAREPLQESAHDIGLEGLSEDHEMHPPLVLIAYIAFTENPLPVRRTMGAAFLAPGQPHPVQPLRDHGPHPRPRPHLPGQPQVTWPVIQRGLTDRTSG